MAVKVELINNPYMQQLRILINGEAVSVYSNLEKYMDEPFYYWCDRILEEIYEECNYEDFYLYFQSRKEELEIMKNIAENYCHCVRYIPSESTRPASLVDRMKKLSALVHNLSGSEYGTFYKSVIFILPENMKWLEEKLKNSEIKNSFCQIKKIIIYEREYLQKKLDGDMKIFFTNQDQLEKVADRLDIHSGFGIFVNDKNTFLRKTGELFLYETQKDTAVDTIFRCLLFSPLLDMFRSCIHSLSDEVKEKYKDQLNELQSISFQIIPIPETTTVEVGRSSRIKFQSDLENHTVEITQLHYTYSEKDVIRCNGLIVEGIKEGKATLYIYKEGEMLPCASVDYTVIKRNRITELTLEDDSVVVGEGDRIRLGYTFLPTDADNVNSIEWYSDNNNVATVDQYGNLQAVKSGNCMIRCYAEQICASCKCIVKPYLKSIIPEIEIFEMIYGTESSITFDLEPKDCIDDQIMINSMDMRIVNVVGQTVKAIGIGKTRIIIQNKEETVRAEIKVRVMTEKEYKKLQKEREKDVLKKEKKSWLSKLFG